MKEIKSLTLVLENCESVTVDRQYLGRFLLDNYSKAYARIAMNSIGSYESYNTLVLQLHPTLNESEQTCLFRESDTNKNLPIDRLNSYNDITQIGLEFEDGDTEHYHIQWSEEDEYNNKYQKTHFNEKTGELFIVIDKDNELTYYFDEDEMNCETLEDTMWGLWED